MHAGLNTVCLFCFVFVFVYIQVRDGYIMTFVLIYFEIPNRLSCLKKVDVSNINKASFKKQIMYHSLCVLDGGAEGVIKDQ